MEEISYLHLVLRGKMPQVKAQVEDGSRKTSPAAASPVRRRGKMTHMKAQV